MTPFEFIRSINEKKRVKDTDLIDREYYSFIVNMGLSLFPDTIFYANQMNINPHLSNRKQYDFFFYSIKKRKRFKKWPKKNNINGENIRLISSTYKYNVSRSKEILKLLSDDDIENLKNNNKEGAINGWKQK
jgi:hypothetical protein